MDKNQIKLALYDNSWWDGFAEGSNNPHLYLRFVDGEIHIQDQGGFLVPPSVAAKLLPAISKFKENSSDEQILQHNLKIAERS